MKCVVKNNSSMDMGPLLPLLKSLLPYSREKLGFNRPPSLFFASDAENASKPLGKTAFYDPGAASITVFVDGRHPKDILRSISHELVHHSQYERGDFGPDMDTGEGYAQKNDALRELEREAYESGNMCFRDWEDENKQALQEAKKYFNEKSEKMSRKSKRNDAIESLLLEKWGFKAKTKEKFIIELPEKKIAPKKTLNEDFIRNIIRESVKRSGRSILDEVIPIPGTKDAANAPNRRRTATFDPSGMIKTVDDYIGYYGALGSIVHDFPSLFGKGKLGNVELKQPPVLAEGDSDRPFTPDEMRSAVKILRDTGNENNRGNPKILAVRRAILEKMVYSMKLGRKGGTHTVASGLQAGEEIQLDPAAYNAVFDEFAEEDALSREVVIGSIAFAKNESNHLGAYDTGEGRRATRGGGAIIVDKISPEWYFRASTAPGSSKECGFIVCSGNDFRIFEADGFTSGADDGIRITEMISDRDAKLAEISTEGARGAQLEARKKYMTDRYKVDEYGNALESARKEGFFIDNEAEKAFQSLRDDQSALKRQSRNGYSADPEDRIAASGGINLYNENGTINLIVHKMQGGKLLPIIDEKGNVKTTKIENPEQVQIDQALGLLETYRLNQYNHAMKTVETGGMARDPFLRPTGAVIIDDSWWTAIKNVPRDLVSTSAANTPESRRLLLGRERIAGEVAKKKLEELYESQDDQFKEDHDLDDLIAKYNNVVESRMDDERSFGRMVAADLEAAGTNTNLSMTHAVSGKRQIVGDMASSVFEHLLSNEEYTDDLMPVDFSEYSRMRYEELKDRYKVQVVSGNKTDEQFMDQVVEENVKLKARAADTSVYGLTTPEDYNIDSVIKQVSNNMKIKQTAAADIKPDIEPVQQTAVADIETDIEPVQQIEPTKPVEPVQQTAVADIDDDFDFSEGEGWVEDPEEKMVQQEALLRKVVQEALKRKFGE